MIIYLYKKTHNKTGFKYLGKTIQDPYKYKGSGDLWKPHIKKHGYDVTTEILKECQTNEELRYWGVYYSELWNIVNEKDSTGRKTWANLKVEDGSGGSNIVALNRPEVKAKRAKTVSDPTFSEKMSAVQRMAQNRAETILKQKLSHVGNLNGRFDPTLYSFIHESGLIETCTRHDLKEKYGLTDKQGGMSKLVSGKKYAGWSLIRPASQ